MSPFDKFDGELLFSHWEFPIIVSYDTVEEELKVHVGDTDVTEEIDESELAVLKADYRQAAHTWHQDNEDAKGDYLYDLNKDD